MLTGPEGLAQPALQQRTLRLYGELVCRRESWAGKLVYAGFAGAASTGLAAASSLAGAASLVVDGDANGMKAQFRDGAFDFLINTLDEALRAIKNEIRQGRPIAIGLMAEPESVRAEAVERGLAAELVLHVGGDAAALLAVGGVVVALGDPLVPSALLETWLQARGWSAGETGGADPVEPVRKRWMEGLPAQQRSVQQRTARAGGAVGLGERG